MKRPSFRSVEATRSGIKIHPLQKYLGLENGSICNSRHKCYFHCSDKASGGDEEACSLNKNRDGTSLFF